MLTNQGLPITIPAPYFFIPMNQALFIAIKTTLFHKGRGINVNK